jgi:hypothetical protein
LGAILSPQYAGPLKTAKAARTFIFWIGSERLGNGRYSVETCNRAWHNANHARTSAQLGGNLTFDVCADTQLWTAVPRNARQGAPPPSLRSGIVPLANDEQNLPNGWRRRGFPASTGFDQIFPSIY